MSFNKVMMPGHLGQDSEIRYTRSDLPIVKLSVATDKGYLGNECGWSQLNGTRLQSSASSR